MYRNGQPDRRHFTLYSYNYQDFTQQSHYNTRNGAGNCINKDKKNRRRKIKLLIGVILLLMIVVVHIPKYNTTLWIGSDVDDLSTLFDRDRLNSMNTTHFDLKVEIGGKIVYQTDSVDFNRYVYTRRDIPLRAGFHKIKITSESMDLDVEKIRYTLFDHYIVIELFPPSPKKGSRRTRVMTGFMPVHFM